jgi:hypothetical protein
MSIVEDDLSRDEDGCEVVLEEWRNREKEELYDVRGLDWGLMLVQQSMLSGPMLVQQSMLNSPMLVQQSKRSVVGDAWIGESLYDKL